MKHLKLLFDFLFNFIAGFYFFRRPGSKVLTTFRSPLAASGTASSLPIK